MANDHDLPGQPNLGFGVVGVAALVLCFIGIFVGAMIAHGEGSEVLGIGLILAGIAAVMLVAIAIFIIAVVIIYAFSDRRRRTD